jgi:hypothetical protein
MYLIAIILKGSSIREDRNPRIFRYRFSVPLVLSYLACIYFLILVDDLYFFLLCHADEMIAYARPTASPNPSGAYTPAASKLKVC